MAYPQKDLGGIEYSPTFLLRFCSHTLEHDMQDYQLPEMLRVGIEDLVLQILILDLGEPTIFLSKALDPPSELAMSNSLKLLETLGAVECRWQQEATPLKRIDHEAQEAKQAASTCGDLGVTSELTALGFHLATLPVDPRVGKMMIYGSLFGCVDSALTVAASMSSRSPFVSPFDKRDQADAARKEFAAEGSDHLTILNAFSQWKDLKRQKGDRDVRSFLTDSFLSRLTLQQMEDLRKQFAGLLTEIGFLPKGFRLHEKNSPENSNASNVGLIKAVLCAGLYPNIIVGPRSLASKNQPAVPPKDSKKVGECAFQSHSKGEVYLHPSTISFSEKSLDSRYCCYHEMVKTSKTYVRDCTTVSPFALLLFGGALEVYQREGVCSVDKWLKFRIAPKPATLVKHLRSQMESILLKKIVAPEEDVTGTPEGKALLQSISALFEEETKARKVPDRSGGETVRPFAFDDNNYNNSGRGGRGRGGGENVRPFDDNNSNSGRGGRGRGGGENVRPFDNNNSNSGRGGRGRDGGRGSRGGGRGGRGRGRRGGGRDS
jgi:ATP-dependent RNA helicase DHX57